MMRESGYDTHRQEGNVEAKPFCDNVRGALHALAQQNRLRIGNVVVCLQEHGCEQLAREVLAAFTWKTIPNDERNGAFYVAMRPTGVRFCGEDAARLFIAAHPQHLSVRGMRVAEFPEQSTELEFQNTEQKA